MENVDNYSWEILAHYLSFIISSFLVWSFPKALLWGWSSSRYASCLWNIQVLWTSPAFHLSYLPLFVIFVTFATGNYLSFVTFCLFAPWTMGGCYIFPSKYLICKQSHVSNYFYYKHSLVFNVCPMELILSFVLINININISTHLSPTCIPGKTSSEMFLQFPGIWGGGAQIPEPKFGPKC